MRSGTQQATIAVAVLQRRAICESAHGNYHTAQQLFGAALRGLGPRGPTRRHLLLWNELGMVCKYLGKFDAAQGFYLRALRHAGRCFQGLDLDSFLADIYHNLGGLNHSRRRFARGAQFARKGIALRRKSARGALPLASDLVALAANLDGLRRFRQSERLYRQALPAYRRYYGSVHPETSLILHNLAAVYQRTGCLRQAESLYRTALRIRRRKLGEHHPDTAFFLNNLGTLLLAQQDFHAASSCFREALEILQSSFGRRHYAAVVISRNLQALKLLAERKK